jgi:hypothetical protein
MSIFARPHGSLFRLHSQAVPIVVERAVVEPLPRFKPEALEEPFVLWGGRLLLEESYWDPGAPAPTEDDH